MELLGTSILQEGGSNDGGKMITARTTSQREEGITSTALEKMIHR
jgi:hypothetical protein